MKRFLAGILCLCLMVTMLPLAALAEGETINGHERMYAADSILTGTGTKVENSGNTLAPTHMGWIYPNNTSFTYENVDLTNAAYVRLCVRLNTASKVNAIFDIYLDEQETPAAKIEFPPSQDFHVEMAELVTPVSGTHKVTVVLMQGEPDLSWIQFVTEEEAVVNGHNRMMMADGARTGYGAIVENPGNTITPTHLGYTEPGATISFTGVKLTDASYVELYTRQNGALTDNAIIKVYLDDEETPTATFEFGACEFVSKLAPMSETVSGLHKVTLVIEQSKPDISWVRFLTEEDVKGIATDGHERMMALDASRSGGEMEFMDNRLAPSILAWMTPPVTISYPYVSLKDAKYVQICTEAHADGNQIDVLLGEEQEQIASFKFDTFKSVHVRTLELDESVTAEGPLTVRVSSGGANFAWIRFFSEEEYANYNPTKVALIGDSNVEYAHYYNGLANLLDPEEYLVQSFGYAGATVGSYRDTYMYDAAMEFEADIYIITLGSNDTPLSEAQIREQVPGNYQTLIDEIRKVNPDAEIYGQTITPIRADDRADGTNPEDPSGRTHKKIVEVTNPLIREVCAENNIEVIDIYDGLMNAKFSRYQLMFDFVHISEAGGKIMAQIVYDAVFAEDLGAGTSPDNAESVTIEAQKTKLTEKGETVTLTANQEVYWRVLSADGEEPTTFATIDENGVLTAQKPGAYQVAAISKADTSVKATKDFYNDFAYKAAEIDYILGNNSIETHKKRESQDVRDGGVRVVNLNDGLAFYLQDVDLTDVTSVTARATAFYDNVPTDTSLEFHLDAADGPMIANCTISDTRILSGWDNALRYGDFKSGVVPVTDGELHDVYAVVNFTNSSFRYDLLSIDFGTDAENPAVMKDGAVVDTYSPNFTWKAGEYTLYSAAESLPVSALYDKDGKVVATALLSGDEGAKQGTLTLSQDVSEGILRTFHWSDLETMKPVTPAHMTYQAPITVGCVGDSITKYRNEDDGFDNMLSFPKFLGLALGNRYEVKNFGLGSRTAGDYVVTNAYQDALEAVCDIYVIQFGNNDCKSDTDLENFEDNYQALIDSFREASPGCAIYLCLPFATYANPYGIRLDKQRDVVVPAVQALAEKNGLPVIDLYNPVVYEVSENDRLTDLYLDDQTHPSVQGMVFIAELVKEGLLAE